MRASGALALALGLPLVLGLGWGACRGKRSDGGSSAGSGSAARSGDAPERTRPRPVHGPRRARPEARPPASEPAKEPCALPWDLKVGLTLAQVVKHFRARRIVVMHLRDHIVTFRPPPLYGVRFRTGRVFVDAAPGSTAPATLVRVELESAPQPDKTAGRTTFLRAARGLEKAYTEIAWRQEAPPRRPTPGAPVPQGIWRWVCGPGGHLRLAVALGRHDQRTARIAGGAYLVTATWRYAPKAARPGPPRHTRFTPLAGPTPDVRGMILRAGARFQDHARVYDLSFLPNGRVVVLGGAGAPESYAGTWRIVREAGRPELRLSLRQAGFYAREHRYRPGTCHVDDQDAVPCLQGVDPPQLPYWYDR